MTLLVLAAGMGSRAGGLKQVEGFGPHGETIMDYSLFDAVRAGFSKVVFIVRQEILEMVRDRYDSRLAGRMQVDCVVQSLQSCVPPPYQNADRVKPWGTGHALLCAQDAIQEPFAVINADDFSGREAFDALAEFFRQDSADTHAMVGYRLQDVLSRHGSVSRGCGNTDSQGHLRSLVERVTIVIENGAIVAKETDGDVLLSPETIVSMNFWGFRPSIFRHAAASFGEFLAQHHQSAKAEFYIPKLVNEMIAGGQVQVKVIPGGKSWFGVTYKEDKAVVSDKIRQLIEAGQYPERLFSA